MLHAFNSNVLLATPLALAAADTIVIGTNGFVYGQGNLVTGLNEGPDSIVVAGTAATAAYAFTLGAVGDEAFACRVTVTGTGLVQGFAGLLYNGSNLLLTNAGTISGDNAAIFLDGGNTLYDNRIVNSGAIVGGHGISSTVWRVSAVTVVNSGVIEGNHGSAIDLFESIDADDSIVNSGLIVGDVALGGGDDLYDGRGGRVVGAGLGAGLNGTVLGGPGNDRFRPGAAEDLFDAEAGTDLLDFRAGGGAIDLALDGIWEATGWAEGDSYTGFENVTGTAFTDRIGGNSGANALKGAGGTDSLFGQAGTDWLEGGGGADTLAGGAGNDAFVFRRLVELGDRVTDFSSTAVGNDDRILISTGFGGGLTVGTLGAALFTARADNLAQDANDRFVFRTTDRTLWFDADGTGAAAGLLVATLQAGATMTAADIVIF